MRIQFTSATFAAALATAAFTASSAQATELCTGPAIPGVPAPGDPNTTPNGSSCGLVAGQTPILAMFIGFSAADTDALHLPGTSPDPVFINQGVGATPVGTTISLAVPLGGLGFVLEDITSGNSFTIGTPYANTDGSSSSVFHFADFTFTTGATDAADEALFNATFPSIPMTAGEFSTIEANGGFAHWTFAGVEDRTITGTDDWNDLVYGFQNVAPSRIPEPTTIFLLGTGLAALSFMRRRRQPKA